MPPGLQEANPRDLCQAGAQAAPEMIYLFCNQQFGKKFLRMAGQVSRQQGARITIVFSDKYRSSNTRTRWSNVSSFLTDTVERYRFAFCEGMSLLKVENVNSPEFTRGIRPTDYGIVAGFNQIFREDTIRRFGSLVNFHPSILPLYRGPVPSYWCIENNEDRTGFTVHVITSRIDAGEILIQGAVPIGSIRDPDVLDQRIAEQAMEPFCAYLRQLQTGEELVRNFLDAKMIYKKHVDYASFPR
jgi:methionyl-tRNA formyltransferase